jgi:CDP-4-dehydro-6-deoxyglucose reductase
MLELHVRRVPGGLFTTHVFETLKERDILRFEGPHGGFHLREDAAKPVILLAGGTGFAPIKAWSSTPATANRRADDASTGAPATGPASTCTNWRRLGERLPGFRYVPVLSDAAARWLGWPSPAWCIAAVMADFPDLSGHQVYACGAPAMIEAARARPDRPLRPAGRCVLCRRLHLRQR